MTNTQMWKFCERHFGSALRRRMHSETGVAMIMALLYTVMFILTLSIVTSVLVGQAIPFKQNKSTQQTEYAAESGLEMGLSFLRQAESQSKLANSKGTTNDYSAFFPTTVVDGFGPDKTVTKVSDTRNQQFVNQNGAVILNNGTLTNSERNNSAVTDYSSTRVTYRVEITYWNGDPTNGDNTGNPGKTDANDEMARITNAADMEKALKAGKTPYALVTGKGYSDRYTGSDMIPADANAVLPSITMQGVYRFGVTRADTTKSTVSGSGSADGAFKLQDNETQGEQHGWIRVDTSTVKYANCFKEVSGKMTKVDPDANGKCPAGTTSGDVAEFTGTWKDKFAASQGEDEPDGETNWIDEPDNNLCMSAVNSSGIATGTDAATSGLQIKLYRQAYAVLASRSGSTYYNLDNDNYYDGNDLHLKTGASHDLNDKVPAGVTITNWNSENAGIAAVNSSGVVTAKGNGEATVTGQDGSGATQVSIRVKVGNAGSVSFGTGDTVTFRYTEECRANGSMGSAWNYDEGDRIRLAGTDLCVTGTDPTVAAYRSNGYRATLEECGTAYSPHEKLQGTDVYRQYVKADGTVDYGYDTNAEKDDAGSALRKFQKWDFFLTFLNAGAWNTKTNSFATVTDMVKGSGNNPGDFLYQALVAGNGGSMKTVSVTNADGSTTTIQRWSTDNSDCGNDTNNHADRNNIKECYLVARAWATNSVSNMKFLGGSTFGDNEQTFNFSLNHGGQSGWTTNQVVTPSGACLDVRGGVSHFSTNNVVTKQCLVDAEPINSWCFAKHVAEGHADDHDHSSTACGTQTDHDYQKYDYVTYERPKVGGGYTNINATEPEYVDTSKKAYETYFKTRNGSLVMGTSTTSTAHSAAATSVTTLQVSSSSTGTSFIRIDDIGNEKFNNKFVLTSSVGTGWTVDDFKNDTAKVSGALCLTEETSGMGKWITRVNGIGGGDASHQRKAFVWGYLDLTSCTAESTTTDIFGRTSSTTQSFELDPANQGNFKKFTSESTTTTTPSTATHGFESMRQYNLERLCSGTNSKDGSSPVGNSCWVI